MLISLYIRNLVIISDLQIPFAQGLTVVTGETGAGKSIVLGALGFCAGHRADSTLVGMRAPKAEVIAEFSLENQSHIEEWLDDSGLASEGACIIRRELSHDGRSRAFINDKAVTVQTLKELGQLLFEFHGQHEHQRLLKPEAQLELLDNFCQHNDKIAEIHLIFRQIKIARDEIERLSRSTGEHSYQAELLKYQIQELEEHAISTAEFADLSKEQEKLAAAESMIRAGHSAVDMLDGDRGVSVTSTLAQLSTSLSPFSELDDHLGEAADLISSSLANVTEASSAIRRYTDGAETDPERQHHVDNQLSQLVELARKHRIRPEDLAEHLQTLQSELVLLNKDETQLQELQAQLEKLEKQFQLKANKISKSRRASAVVLSDKVNQSLKLMGMDRANFQVNIIPVNQDY